MNQNYQNILMKGACLMIAITFLIGCNANQSQKESTTRTDSVNVQPKVEQDIEEPLSSAEEKVFSNERFKDVTVERIGEHKFTIEGKAQIFEANFGWVVEDGHDELQKGHEMTDAGAPEWGDFKFTIDVKKKRENSSLHLILFESSAKDGSRQHELFIPLY
ncbi:Gmad2 immunoglobulin-like domain-containing protein [Marivirga sp. S37H4]|uniref:Gmad2 immunoglobulin-like domain-containing protein n=1 Tax=Marivirga aurantiaca TaxID=2802615 RepID=A0A934WVY6_9BACT|nr:Gmad2 immunoglobulin-like domain-containing protein [Marivirga aurantiaca]MBK6263959.1 Gmad2 immunoglobulin-like domain-containing protein [Marivirga aurantiaca]